MRAPSSLSRCFCSLSIVVDGTCSDNPLEISFERLGKVLLHSQLSEGFPPLHTGPLVTELSAKKEGEKRNFLGGRTKLCVGGRWEAPPPLLGDQLGERKRREERERIIE